MEDTEKTLVTRAEAADMFMVTVRTINRWTAARLIHKYTNDMGHVRVCVEEIREKMGNFKQMN